MKHHKKEEQEYRRMVGEVIMRAGPPGFTKTEIHKESRLVTPNGKKISRPCLDKHVAYFLSIGLVIRRKGEGRWRYIWGDTAALADVAKQAEKRYNRAYTNFFSDPEKARDELNRLLQTQPPEHLGRFLNELKQTHQELTKKVAEIKLRSRYKWVGGALHDLETKTIRLIVGPSKPES